MEDHKEFPNGITSYLETYYEVVLYLESDINMNHSMASVHNGSFGRGGMYELAETITDKFELQFKDTNWGLDLEYFDTLYGFLTEYEKNYLYD